MSENPQEPSDPSRPQTLAASHPHPHWRRGFLIATATVSALVMLVAATGMGTYLWVRSQIVTIPGSELPPGDAAAAGGSLEPEIAGFCDDRACNYLLLGSDSREGLTPEELVAFGDDEHIGGENRADTIILVHTRPGGRGSDACGACGQVADGDAGPPRLVREPRRLPGSRGRARRRGHVRPVPDVRRAHVAGYPRRLPALRRRHGPCIRADAAPAVRRGSRLRKDQPAAAVPASRDIAGRHTGGGAGGGG